MFHFVLLLLLNYVQAEEDACTNPYYDLSQLRGDVDYETPPFKYGGLEWTIVYNFCQNTEKVCLNKRHPAFMRAPNLDSKCMAMFPGEEWKDAEWYVNDESNIIGVILIRPIHFCGLA